MPKPSHEILRRFPKNRPSLPEAYRRIYNQHYFQNREGKYKTTSLSQKLESWMHRQVAADVCGKPLPQATLEIGAGTLNQLQYERPSSQYDIVEPFVELFRDSPHLSRVRRVFSSVEEVDSHPTYDRITSVATFEHIMDLPRVVAQAAMLLKPHGTLRVGIPNEGTLLWWMGTQVTGYEFKRRYGLDYGVLMRYEHVNTANDIEQVLNAFFGSVKCRVFGLCRNLAFYRYLECASPDIEFSKRYCESTTHRAA